MALPPVRTLLISQGDVSFGAPLTGTAPEGVLTVITCIILTASDLTRTMNFLFSFGPGGFIVPAILKQLGEVQDEVSATVSIDPQVTQTNHTLDSAIINLRLAMNPGDGWVWQTSSGGGVHGHVTMTGFTLSLP